MDKQLLLDFAQAQTDLKKLKKLELELRNKVIKSYRYTKHEGIEHREFDQDGVKAKVSVTMKLSRSLDVDAIDTLWSDLAQIERDVILHKPSLDLKAYKSLVESGDCNLLAKAITEKPAQSSVKIVFEE